MNQKGFINIILIVIVVALVGAGSYFVLNRQASPSTPVSTLPPSSTPTPTSSNTTTPLPKISLPSSENNGTQKLTTIATESRNRFIKAGLTEQYFDQHFQFKNTTDVMGADGKPALTYVYWIYKVGEYKVDDIVDTISYVRPNDPLAKQHNIEKIISLKEGVDKLSSCIGKSLTEKDVSVFYEYRFDVVRMSGLYLSGNGNINGSGVGQGEINLENGKCEIHKSTLQ